MTTATGPVGWENGQQQQQQQQAGSNSKGFPSAGLGGMQQALGMLNQLGNMQGHGNMHGHGQQHHMMGMQPGYGMQQPGYGMQQPGYGQYPMAGGHAPAGYPAMQQQPYGAPAQHYGFPVAQQQQHYAAPPQQHYGAPPPMPMPAQHALMAHGGAHGAGGALVGQQYCFPQRVEFVMHERFGVGQNDDFDITDVSGRVYFKLNARMFSIGDKRTLLDAYGQPCVSMAKKMLTLHGTWVMYRGASFDLSSRIADVKPSLMSLTPSFKVYLNDGDKVPDFTASGDFLSKKFTIYQRAANGSERAIAQVSKASRFSSTEQFMRNALLDKQSYRVAVEPGVDAAFVVALATLIDEIYHDAKE